DTQRHPIALQTLCQRLSDCGKIDTVGGVTYLTQLLDRAPSPANFAYWQHVLREKAMLRRIVRLSQQAITSAYEVNGSAKPLDILDSLERDVFSVRQNSDTRSIDEVDKCGTIQELTADYDQAARGAEPPGLATGFPDLDLLLGGVKSQQLIV